MYVCVCGLADGGMVCHVCAQVVAGLVYFLGGLPDTIIDTPFAGTDDTRHSTLLIDVTSNVYNSCCATGTYISVIIAAAFMSGAISSLGFILTSIPADLVGDSYEEETRKKLFAVVIIQVVEAIHSSPSGGEAMAAGAAASSELTPVRIMTINK